MLSAGSLLQNRYRIVRRLGGGGMADVYLAEDTRLAGRRCAIKSMSPAVLPAADRNWAISAFQQEARMLATLRHRGLTPVTDFFPEGGSWHLVMEFIEGVTLEDKLQGAPGNRLPLPEALTIIYQLCDVLDYLHRQTPPVIFRDLKPSNVMITPEGEVKLIDFGIARFFKPGKPQDTVNLGTPGYAAPEQHGLVGQTDARSDIYALGVVLHQLLTGHDPTTTIFTLPPARSLNPAIPPAGELVINRATQVDAALRFQRVAEFRQALGMATPTPTAMMPVTPPIPGQVPTQYIPPPTPAGYVPTQYVPPPSGPSSQIQKPTLDRNKWVLIGAALLVVLAIGTAAIISSPSTPTPAPITPKVIAEITDTIPAPAGDVSGAGPTSSPTPTRTAQPQPPVATTKPPSSTPRPTSTPRPRTPTPTCNVTGTFAGVWTEFKDRLGCPKASAYQVNGAMEHFNQGRMYWREDIDMIYALYRSGRWEGHRDEWNEGDPDYTCDAHFTPPTPLRGFGKIWCTYPSVRSGVGSAADYEYGVTLTIQNFEKGFIMYGDDRSNVLFYDGTWEKR